MVRDSIVSCAALVNLDTLSDDRSVFPNVNINFKRVFTIEQLLQSLFLFASLVVNNVEREAAKFHPITTVLLLNIFVHVRSDEDSLLILIVELLVVEFRYLVEMKTTELVQRLIHVSV